MEEKLDLEMIAMTLIGRAGESKKSGISGTSCGKGR